jgi:DNA-binding response OmpR family regulator
VRLSAWTTRADWGEDVTDARVLVVEDEPLLAETLCDLLGDAGCEAIGPATDVAGALSLIEHSRIDVALLDIRLADETSFPVAHRLRQRGIPMMFLTAHQGRGLPIELGDAIVIEKPFHTRLLLEAVRQMLSQAEATAVTEAEDHRR